MEPFKIAAAANGVEMVTIRSWQERFPYVSAGFTTRIGGVSQGPYGSLNCGYHVSDSPADVALNRERLAQALGISTKDATYAEQVHGCEIAVVTAADGGKGVYSREDALQAKDGFITCEAGIFLHGLFADCVPLYFIDPVHQAVGLAHAGWKGSVLQIARQTITAMQREYGSNPAEIHAAIGPSIGICCYEVDEKVIGRVQETMRELSDSSPVEAAHVYRDKGGGKYMLDLQQLNRQIMIKAGILPTHIELSTLCTSCHTEWFYSHRKEGGTTGRMAAWIGMIRRHER
ncbi:peptidoglycan editing factor PgeF [Paenibacillus thalictri]|uniref:Purine nucleoside phosphorylase n=1 Tax=Paenibacillus thalictri TaxID=2527873 RepID=A0A4Q9DU01_9BACL|nr:peptidoglycan editing factor PgeF [Paenibacillus thalictri]TBL78167.1 peptidoglycan editing factor PgeF [Paenibacillus thalictri]